MKATEAFKLHRGNAPETSVKAAHNIDTSKLKQLVYDEIKESGRQGITAKEILAKYPHLPYSSITARPKSLEEDGLIEYVGDKRDGARVMRIKEAQLTLV